MKKLQKIIKTKDDFAGAMEYLANRVKSNHPISDNPMLDGLIIGFMMTTQFTSDLFLNHYMGLVLDGTMSRLEQISIWLTANEDALYKILKDRK